MQVLQLVAPGGELRRNIYYLSIIANSVMALMVEEKPVDEWLRVRPHSLCET